jgi:hypothetical protein
LRKSSNRALSKGVPLPWLRAVFEKGLYGLHRVSSLGLQQAFAQLRGLNVNSCDPEIFVAAPLTHFLSLGHRLHFDHFLAMAHAGPSTAQDE